MQLSWASLSYSSPKHCNLDVFNSLIPCHMGLQIICWRLQEKANRRKKGHPMEARVYDLIPQFLSHNLCHIFLGNELVISTSTQREGYSGLWTQETRPIHGHRRCPNILRWNKTVTSEIRENSKPEKEKQALKTGTLSSQEGQIEAMLDIAVRAAPREEWHTLPCPVPFYGLGLKSENKFCWAHRKDRDIFDPKIKYSAP